MEWVGEVLKANGLAGAAIFGLATAVVVLWRQNNAQRDVVDALHEKRVTEAREAIVALNANTAATETNAEAIERQAHTIQSFMETMRALFREPADRGRG